MASSLLSRGSREGVARPGAPAYINALVKFRDIAGTSWKLRRRKAPGFLSLPVYKSCIEFEIYARTKKNWEIALARFWGNHLNIDLPIDSEDKLTQLVPRMRLFWR